MKRYARPSSISCWRTTRTRIPQRRYPATPAQTESEGHDLMGPETIQTGATQSYKVDDGLNDCQFSFKATRADNAPPIYVTDIRVCSVDQVELAEPTSP